jgi:hypothetical protein
MLALMKASLMSLLPAAITKIHNEWLNYVFWFACCAGWSNIEHACTILVKKNKTKIIIR